jgi:hypothetical protein
MNRLYFDDIDYFGLDFWYKDAKEYQEEIDKEIKKSKNGK